jgi:hypothetical protein
MAGFLAAALNSMLDHLGTEITYAGLIGTDGTAEVIGGSPAYARKAVTWGTAAGSSMLANGTMPVFDVPACTVTKVSLMSASTSGTTYLIIDVTDEVFAAQGTYTVSGMTLSGA